MNALIFLIIFPFFVALLMRCLNPGRVRDIAVILSALIIAAASIFLLVAYINQGLVVFSLQSDQVSLGMFAVEIFLAVLILYLGIKNHKSVPVILVLIQTAIIAYFEFTYGHSIHLTENLFIDQFSIIMALIIGIIGSLISVYALRYMDYYHAQHKEIRDRRPYFFFLFFIFLSAMFGLVFSNNLLWVFFFWEITTICSFLLIGYAKTTEATNNAFLALSMNMLGGIAFATAILWLTIQDPTGGTLELQSLIASGKAVALIPAVLICFAGITKSALMPFSTWLVGAMVAPTPVSALLHSSTMVKAGVYIIVRFSPVLSGSVEGLMIALVGGFTFLLASGIAISQSNAKKVLAYSTIANLGLIVACAGVGTPQLVWAAILLIIFHAIAKSLLFLCVGTVELRTGSKDIEDMAGLIVRMPRLAIMMFIGIAGMFLAPFGMLISKWAALEGFIDAPFGLIFVAILAFGGSITVFFWSKWMGKIISVTRGKERIEESFGKEKWGVLYILTTLIVLVCLIFPLISGVLIEPYVFSIYGQTTRIAQDNITIMAMMIFLLMILPFSLLLYRNDVKYVTPYMGGRPTTNDVKFSGSMGYVREMTLTNYYITQYFGEQKLLMAGTALGIGLILVAGIHLFGVIL